jgi:hypothetical protein
MVPSDEIIPAHLTCPDLLWGMRSESCKKRIPRYLEKAEVLARPFYNIGP